MRWRTRVGMWLLNDNRRSLSKEPEDILAERQRFVANFSVISDACSLFAKNSGMSVYRLTATYMDAALAEDAAWWQENGEDASHSWFIWQYGEKNGWFKRNVSADEASRYIIRPENEASKICIMLCVKRMIGAPEQGWITVNLPQEPVADQILRKQKCYPSDEGGYYLRKINEINGSVLDRAVEISIALLTAGYSVAVQDRKLYEKILSGEYVPEHPYWIYEAPQQDLLYLRYPRDGELHRYVSMAGAHWNGKRTEIPISCADEVEELARCYGFRITREAQRRLDTWHEAVKQAVVYRGRKHKDMPYIRPEDKFGQLLSRPIQVPEDLQDV